MPPAARITDMHVCPMVTGVVPHVGGPILPPGAPTVLIDFLPAATVTTMATCVGPPDIIVMGSTGVLINFMPAARLGDPTAHGGVIVMGSPTCIIGEMGVPSPGAGGLGGIVAGMAASGLNQPAQVAEASLYQQGRAWLESHPDVVKGVGAVVIGVTAISGIFDGGASEAAIPEEVAAEEAILDGGASEAPEATLDPKIQKTLDHIDENGSAPQGYTGGRTFQNDGRGGGQTLPGTEVDGTPIEYKEWDVDPKMPGVPRNGDRLVTGSDGSAYYTDNHYQSFQKLR